MVTFVPPAEVYMTKMFEPLMLSPWPRATQARLVGADSWKKTSPSPEDAVASGMLKLKHTSDPAHCRTAAETNEPGERRQWLLEAQHHRRADSPSPRRTATAEARISMWESWSLA